jgi:hypothetical protein
MLMIIMKPKLLSLFELPVLDEDDDKELPSLECLDILPKLEDD